MMSVVSINQSKMVLGVIRTLWYKGVANIEEKYQVGNNIYIYIYIYIYISKTAAYNSTADFSPKQD